MTMSMLTVKEARERIIDSARNYGEESVFLQDALGRILAEDVLSDRNYPPFNRATMDGYAIKSEDYHNGIRDFEVLEEVFAGKVSTVTIGKGQCIKIMTGVPVPGTLDAVIKVEDTFQKESLMQVEEIFVFPHLNIALEGEDSRKGQIIINKNTPLTPPEISSLAVIGQEKVQVYKLPRIAIISTGNEIKSLSEEVALHQIRDSNSYAIEAFLNKYKIPVSFRKIVRDNEEDLYNTLKEALNYDILISSGGVSMGDADFMPSVFTKLGIEQKFHKVQMKPGKPIWFGQSTGSVVFGLPGNPVSVQVACRIFVEPFLRKSFGLSPIVYLRLPLLDSKSKKTKFDEFFPCSLSTAETTGLSINQFNGSGDITATLLSDGIGLHEASKGDLKKGEIIDFFPWKF